MELTARKFLVERGVLAFEQVERYIQGNPELSISELLEAYHKAKVKNSRLDGVSVTTAQLRDMAEMKRKEILNVKDNRVRKEVLEKDFASILRVVWLLNQDS
jgi:hypothetical protein